MLGRAGGRACFRADRLVAEIDHPGAERPRLEQLQPDAILQWREEWGTGAQDQRMHEQADLLDQPRPQQRRGGGGTAHVDVEPRLRYQACHFRHGVIADQAAIPLDALERPGKHDLRLALPDAGELELHQRGRWIGLSGGPVVDHQLVHPSPVQEGAHLARLVVPERVQLVVDQDPVEGAARRLNEAVERHGHRVDESAH